MADRKDNPLRRHTVRTNSSPFIEEGKLKEALEAEEAAFRRAPWWPPIVGVLAAILSLSGEQERANQLIANMSGGSLPMGMMSYHLFLAQYDAAIGWYEQAIEQRLPAAAFLAPAVFLKPLRAHARWPKLAKMMNRRRSASRRLRE